MKLKITDLQNTELLKKIVNEVKVQSSPQIDFVEVESSDSKRDIFGIDELVYNPVTGENGSVGFGYDRGRKVKGITWGGHDTHLHVGFTNKKVAMELIEKARELGLYVGQNVYNKASRNVVTKCHVDDSFHYKLFPGEPLVSAGADISGKKSKMEELIVWAINKYANEKVEVEKYKSDDSVIKKERTDERKVLSGMKKFYKKNTILKYDESKVNEFNQDIWDLQFALQFLGFYPDKIDGKFTPLTRKAIGKFQKSIGNKKTGNYKSNEIKPLFEKLKENSFITKGHTPMIGTNDLQSYLKKTTKDSFKTGDSEYIILKPKDFDGTDVHVFFGGYHTNPSYSKGGHDIKAMKYYEQFLEPYANNRIILITHHINTLGSVESFVEKKFPGKKVVSIAGFSQGGRETWRHAEDSNLKLVGLIDPSTYNTGLTFGSNTYMVCNPSNWGGTSFTNACRERLKWYCENKDKGGYSGHIECPKIGHTGLVTYFYNKFSSKI